MPFVHLDAMDLNLLKALDVLLEERNVTRAARRSGLTQPAMSRALGRLRDALGDPLLVRSGRGLAVTARAEALRPRLHEALSQLDAVVAEGPGFDPATARRTFHLETADYGMAVVVPALLSALAEEAPGIDVVVHPQSGDFEGALASGAVDVVVLPKRGGAPDLVWSKLVEDDYVCLVREGHPEAARPLTVARFCALRHVLVSPALAATGAVDQALAKLGRRRTIALRVPSFLVAPRVVAETDLVAVVPRRLAPPSDGDAGVRALPLPIAVPPLLVSMAWHERSRSDAGHAWLRRRLLASHAPRARP